MIIDPLTINTKDLHQFLLAIVAPRPIAFVSTVDLAGNVNLAPFSFFNCFSSNPPIVVFSANRRVSDNTTKDTLANVIATGECVINAVSYPIVRQMALCSVDYPTGVNEFEKSGLTPIPSNIVKPPRVAECLAHLECKVTQILPLGEGGGAGNLVICEVVQIHVDESVIDERNRIDPDKIDLMGRMGRLYYSRASGDSIYSINQPVQPIPIGFDALPQQFKASKILSANDLGALASLEAAPTLKDLELFTKDEKIVHILSTENTSDSLQLYAHELLKTDLKKEAYMAMYLSIDAPSN